MRTWVLLAAMAFATPAWAQDAPPSEVAMPPGPLGLTGTLVERYDALASGELDRDATTLVKDVVVETTALTWHLIEGRFVPLRLPGGETAGGWFVGQCALTYVPPDGREADAFARATGSRAFTRRPCTEGLLQTDDPAILARLAATDLVAPPPDTAMARRVFENDSLVGLQKKAWAAFAANALAAAARGTDGVVELRVAVDGAAAPRWKDGGGALDTFAYLRHPGGRGASETVRTFGAREGGTEEERWRAALTVHGERRPLDVDVEDAIVALDITVDGAAVTAVGTAALVWRPLEAPVQVLEMNLLSTQTPPGASRWGPLTARVVSVVDAKARPLSFLHRAGRLLVRFDEPIPPGEKAGLVVTYGGRPMYRVGEDSFWMPRTVDWWPSPGPGDRFTWQLTLCVPPDFEAAGVGVGEAVEDPEAPGCRRWKEDHPVSSPGFGLGRLRGAETLSGDVPVKTWFLDENRDAMKPALNEAVRAIGFFEGLFGPFPFGELEIVQGLDSWVARPGYIEISTIRGAASRSPAKDTPEEFYPRVASASLVQRVARQWWGGKVGPRGPGALWLADAFAEYASLLYMAQHYGEASYAGRLQWWEHSAREADPYGPVVLGTRLGVGAAGQFRGRAPYVLHMLRGAVGDEAFLAWMRAIVDVVGHRDVSTEEVILIAEKVLGPPARPFFERWLLQTGLPDLELTWMPEGDEVVVTLKQTQPEAPYTLGVTIALDGRGKASETHLISLPERSTTVILPAPPGGVRAVRIDPDYDLLTGKKDVKKR